MTKRTPSIESFGPELMAALLKGARERYTITLPYRSAIKFRQRIYLLRQAMREANHEMYSAVSRTRITITWPEATPTQRNKWGFAWPLDRATLCIVTVEPQDSEFASALAQAGVETKELESDPLATVSPEVPPGLSDYAPEE